MLLGVPVDVSHVRLGMRLYLNVVNVDVALYNAPMEPVVCVLYVQYILYAWHTLHELAIKSKLLLQPCRHL